MKRLEWVAVGALLAALSGCSDTVHCNLALFAVLRVHVVDESGGERCDVTVTAKGAGERFTLDQRECHFSGGTSAGSYVITVSRGDEELARSSATVGTGECGAIPKDVTIVVP